MNQIPILKVVEFPETTKPECESNFTRVTFVEIGKHRWWQLKFAVNIFGEVYEPQQDNQFQSSAELLGRLHAWGLSSSNFPKYILMTKEASDLLRPAMCLPVFDCVLEVSAPEF